jgi:hypothetical protein
LLHHHSFDSCMSHAVPTQPACLLCVCFVLFDSSCLRLSCT